MKSLKLFPSQRGQGMTEYIVIVALIAIAAIGVYKAFGTVVKGQTAAAASTLAGGKADATRTTVKEASNTANAEGQKLKDLSTFEQ
jgi:type IV pilus assembly protein PilA